MITISEPVVTKVNDNLYTVAVTVTNTDEGGKVIGSRSININMGKEGNAVEALQPLIDGATDDLLKEVKDVDSFKAQFNGFKVATDASIATKIANIGKIVIAFLLMTSSCFAVTTDTISYGTSTAINCTLGTPLANSSTVGRASQAVDNSVNNFTDAIVTTSVKVGEGTIANDKAIYVYLYGSEDGTNYEKDSSGTIGTDANYTIDSPTNLRLATVIPVAVNSTIYTKTFTVANAFGGVMPRKWGICVVNYCGVSLNTTESNHIKTYTGIKYQNQ
jgi:hypothetical protein